MGVILQQGCAPQGENTPIQVRLGPFGAKSPYPSPIKGKELKTKESV